MALLKSLYVQVTKCTNHLRPSRDDPSICGSHSFLQKVSKPIGPPRRLAPPGYGYNQPTNQQFFGTNHWHGSTGAYPQPTSAFKQNAAQPLTSWTNAPVSKRRMSCVEDRLDPFRTTMPPLSPPPSTRQMADMAVAEYWRAKMWQELTKLVVFGHPTWKIF